MRPAFKNRSTRWTPGQCGLRSCSAILSVDTFGRLQAGDMSRVSRPKKLFEDPLQNCHVCHQQKFSLRYFLPLAAGRHVMCQSDILFISRFPMTSIPVVFRDLLCQQTPLAAHRRYIISMYQMNQIADMNHFIKSDRLNVSDVQDRRR